MTHRTAGAARAAFPFLFAGLALAACTPPSATSPEPRATGGQSGVILANMDTSVRPQDDFYRYVNGTWLKTDQIPPDRSNYGSFTKLTVESQDAQRAIIEEIAAKGGYAPGSDEQKIGDLYKSFMDEQRAETLGVTPLNDELARIKAVKTAAEIPALVAHLSTLGVPAPIGIGVGQDAKEPTQYIVLMGQSGLGLPDRDYYLLDDAKFKEIRAAYLAHIQKTLALGGDKNAAVNAQAIMNLETKIAKEQWTKVDSRDDDKTYNKFDRAALQKLVPQFRFDALFAEAGIDPPAVVVAQPSALTGFGKLLAKEPIGVWRAYFRWKLLSTYSPYLSQAFVDESFGFYGKTLRGIKENKPRWKRAVNAVHGGIEGDGSPYASKGVGEILGKLYVARYFPPEAKARMEEMVKNLLAAYHDSIEHLDWMSPETRTRALEKLSKFMTKIGYPNKWRDYSELAIKPDDLVGNLMRASIADDKFQFGHLGKPVDRDEWHMSPQTVNAYYNDKLNEIVFPAAILRPPFFNLEAEDAVNYGSIGAVIAHEIGHGFDDQGSKSDGDGRLQSWWTAEDRAKFEQRAKMLIEQYNAYEPLPGQHINGALTIGENIGDLGGASIAYKAYLIALKGKPSPVLDGFTGQQRYFIGFAQIWARQFRDAALLERIKSDPHSPDEYRAREVINSDAFYEAFNVKPGDKMYLPPEQRVRIW